MRPVIIVFAKAPVPGRVKTRLVPPLTNESAALLHAAFVADTIERFEQLGAMADLQLHTDIPTDAWQFPHVARRLQHEGDLGLKMLQALETALREGREQALITGSDSPTLPLRHVETLLRSAADVALGPSEDGGYYAIACRRTHLRMFDGVKWSEAAALDQTVAAAQACGLSVEIGPSWYDIDTPGDLERLRAEPGLPRHTAKMFLWPGLTT